MKLTFQLFICSGIPLIGIFLYHKLFSRVEDNVVFQIGFVNTINYLLWFLQISTIAFFGYSGMGMLLSLYLIFIAPILSLGFLYWILLHRKDLVNYRYALFTSISYLSLFLVFGSLIHFYHLRSN